MIAFHIWSIPIYRYGIFYLITFVIGYTFLWRVGKTERYKAFPHAQKMLTKWVDDIILGTVIGILVGGRLGEVLLYNREYYSQHPMEIFAIWQWGMSFIGGIVGVVLALLLLNKIYKLSRKDLLVLFDLILVIVPIGIILGRYGNFLNQELYGIIAPARVPEILTHTYPQIDNATRINTNLISMLAEWFLTFFISITLFLKQFITKKITPGVISVTFILLYSTSRFLFEYLRQDSQSQFMGRFTTTQWFMLCFFLFGIALWKYLVHRR